MTILKEKDFKDRKNVRHAAGDNQEKDVAFYLKRAFKDDPSILIINDLKIQHEGEKAQIDHLVIHRTGFVIIESKSIYGEVKINSQGEWSRSFKGSWSGMPSPLRQAETQKDLLLQYLNHNADSILRKLLGFQTFFSGRDWDVFCSVSNSCILHRDNMPSEISKHVIKSECIAKEVKKIVSGSFVKKAILSNKPFFTANELENIAELLVGSDLFSSGFDKNAEKNKRSGLDGLKNSSNNLNETASGDFENKDNSPIIQCKKCYKADKLTPQYGKFGYYVQCGHCSTNTSMKMSCPSCGSKEARISKKGNDYSVVCSACNSRQLVISA